MKSILIATDFSKHSKYTIRFILDFMKDTKIPCNIFLLNTFLVLQSNANQVISDNDELKKISKFKLNQEIIEAKNYAANANIIIEAISHMGSLNNVILQLLHKQIFDLVAMGKDEGKHVETISTLLKEEGCTLLVTYLKE